MDAVEAIIDACDKSIKTELGDFVKRNSKFWKQLPEPKEIKGSVLLEDFSNCVYCGDWVMQSAVMLNRAKGYSPLFFDAGYNHNYFKSFVSTAKEVKLPKISKFKKLIIKLHCFYTYHFQCNSRKGLLNFKYDGINYGDLLYDEYIRNKGIATFHKKDAHLKFVIKRIMELHEQYKALITNKENNIKAVTLTQTVALSCTIPYRLAIKLGIEAYILTDFVYYKLEKMKEYPRTPRKEEIDAILSLPNNEFNNIYNKVHQMHIGGCKTDAKNAFNDNNKFYNDKLQFCKDYNLDPNKKNVFVMLHAFNDYPHSHFDNMLFDDYYQWFYETLEYAKKDRNVNWIFKQHPSYRSYKAEDVNYDKLFKNIPDNIKPIGFNNDMLDSRSLEYIGDAVITCIGSCGYDMPAMFGIPSIIAGDNHYMGYSFTKHPKSKKEYFEFLSELKDIKKITPEAKKQARAMYIYILYCTAVVPPTLVKLFEDPTNPETVCWSLSKTIQVREDKHDEVISFFKEVIEKLSKNDFKEYRNNPRNLLD